MKILYIHQYFKTPDQSAQNRSYILARSLIENGHKVIMLTASNTVKEYDRRNIDGIDVVYFGIKYNQSMSALKRVMVFINFMFKSTLFAFKQKNLDLVVATSTPIFVGFPALLLKRIKKIPFIFEVRDLWPEAPIQLGWLKNKFLISLARHFEKKLYREAWHIIALSPGILKKISSTAKIDTNKLTMIPNISRIDSFFPHKIDTDYIKKFKLGANTFKVIYFGSFGAVNDMRYILEVAREMKKYRNIEFIILGDGSAREEMVNFITKNQLNNIKLFSSQPMSIIVELVNLADVSIMAVANHPILKLCSPNKFFDTLAAGKPMIINFGGWIGDLLVKNKCGYNVYPYGPSAMADKIIKLSNSPQLIKNMGKAARELAIKEFSDKIATGKFIEIVEKL